MRRFGTSVVLVVLCLIAAPVAAQPTEVDELLSEINPYNVKHSTWGASTGDSGAANAVSIQAALDAAATAGGGTVLITELYPTDDIVVPDRVSLLCMGDDSGLICDGCTTLLSYATAGSNNGRAKSIRDCIFDGASQATTILKIADTSSLVISNVRATGGAASGSKCLWLEGTQNSLIEKSEFRDCDTTVYLNASAANNIFLKNEITRSTTAHLLAEESSGENMHGNAFIGNLWERDRDGAAPWTGPTYGVRLTGGRNFSFFQDRVGSPAQTANFSIIGPTGTSLPAGQVGARSVAFFGGGMNLSSADPQFWNSGDCGMYVDGSDVSLDSFGVSNGNTRCWLEAETSSSTKVNYSEVRFETGTSSTTTGNVVTIGDNGQVNSVAVADFNLNSTTPAAAAGRVNLEWQRSGSAPDSVSVQTTAAMPIILARESTLISIASSTTETDIFNFTVPANAMGTNRMLRLTIIGARKNDSSGQEATPTFRVYVGGTERYDDPVVRLPKSVNWSAVKLEVLLSMQNASNVMWLGGLVNPQSAQGNADTGIGNLENTSLDGDPIGAASGTTFAQTTTSDWVLRVTWANGTNNANTIFRRHYAILELL